VWWVDLSGLQDPTLVPLAVGQALGVPLEGSADASTAVLNALQGKSALLVLDNAEHLLEGVARFAVALRARVPTAKLLVTSQEVLHLLDEQVFRPGPLALPALDDLHSAQGSGAVALFVMRARQADPHFSLSEANLHAVVDICRQLDGIPLAIELAAARVRLLGVDGVRQRLGERFSMLTAGARAVLRRHQTLRATLEWSHGLLTAPEQVVLRRLAVFVGGFTLDAAQDVAADECIDVWEVLELLGTLVDKSMVMAEGDPMPRYRLLESTRMYALERLADAGETDTMLHRHAQVQLQLAQAFDTAATELGHAGIQLQQMDLERDNILNGLDWCSRQSGADAAVIALRLVASLRYFWPSRGMLPTGIAAAQRVLDHTRGVQADKLRFKALNSLVHMLNLTQEQSERADLACAELLESARASGERLSVVISELSVGHTAAYGRRWATASEHFETALGLARELGNLNLQCNAMGGLAAVLEGRGEMEEAREMLEASLALRRRTGHAHNIAVDLLNLASLTLDRHQPTQASALLCESVPLIRATGSVFLEAALVRAVARLLALQGQWEASVELHAAAATRCHDHGTEPSAEDLRTFQADLDAAVSALGAAAQAKAWAAGAALDHAGAFELSVLRLNTSREPVVPDGT
jgi:predicted ATPase